MELMEIIAFKDFYKRRHTIKALYFLLSLKDKYCYKWYIYANPLMKEYAKDAIWEYLNDDINNKELREVYRKVRV